MNSVTLAGRLECEQAFSNLKRGDLKRLQNLKGNAAFMMTVVGPFNFQMKNNPSQLFY